MSYLQGLGCWNARWDVRWRMRNTPPLFPLNGGSSSGGMFAALWHLQKEDIPNDASVTVSATLTENGTLEKVTGIEQKLKAIEKILTLSTVVVAHNQDDVEAGPRGRLQIIKVEHVANPAAHGCKEQAHT